MNNNNNNNNNNNIEEITYGKCDLCDVVFTSLDQKNTHLAGKRHKRNAQLTAHGQPPNKRQRTNKYYAAYESRLNGQQYPSTHSINNMNMNNGYPNYYNNPIQPTTSSTPTMIRQPMNNMNGNYYNNIVPSPIANNNISSNTTNIANSNLDRFRYTSAMNTLENLLQPNLIKKDSGLSTV